MRSTKFVTHSTLAGFIAALLVSATAQEDAPPDARLLISALGSVQVPYDMVSLDVYIDVKVTNDGEGDVSSASVAQDKHDRALQALWKTLNEDLGFPYENVTTSGINLYPLTNYSDGKTKNVGYDVSSTSTLQAGIGFDIAAIVDAIAKQDTESKDGVAVSITLSSYQPYISHPEVYKKDLLASAMEHATTNALMYAEIAQRELGSILRISDAPLSAQPEASPPVYDHHHRTVTEKQMPPPTDPPTFPTGRGQDLRTTIYLEYQLL